MSYNCDKFNLKKIENFSFPVDSLFKSARHDWHPERINNDDGTTTFSFGEPEIKGTIKGKMFLCSEINCCGEGSGFVMNKILEPAFKDSKGVLVASLVWEGGDSINRLTVEDGNVLWEDIEI